MAYTLRGFVLLMILALLIGCGGGGSGKTLAQDAVKAIQEQDEEKLEQISERFEALGPAQKLRFATEMAKSGEEVRDAIQEFIGTSLPQ